MKYLVVCFLTLVNVSVYCQSSLTRILSAPVNDEDYLIALKQQQYIENHKFNSPWLRELEVRMRSDDKQLNIDEYRMRLGLINPAEVLANRKYNSLIAEYNQAEKASIINDVLKLRYELLIEYHYLLSKEKLTNQLIQRREKQQKIRIDLNPNLDKIVDLEQGILKGRLALVELENKQDLISKQIRQFSSLMPESEAFDQLISPEQIILRLDTSIDESQLLAEKQLDLAVKEQLLKIDKAEAYSNIGYIQGDYDISQGDVFSDHLGFQMGVSLPIFNTDRPKLQRDELKLVDDQVKNELLLDKTKNRIYSLKDKISSAYEQYKIVMESEIKLNKWKEMSEGLSADQGTFNELAGFEDFVNNSKLELHVEMLNLYITFMHEKSELNGSSPTNQIIDPIEKLDIK